MGAGDAQYLPAAAVGSPDVVARLVVGSRALNAPAVRKSEARLMPWALDAAVDELALRERPARVGALRVQRVHGLARAQHDEALGPGFGGGRDALGDLGHIELGPLWLPEEAPRVPVDHVAEGVDEFAADEGAGRQQSVTDQRQHERHHAVAGGSGPAQTKRDEVHDQREDHDRRVDGGHHARVVVGVAVIGRARNRRSDHGQDAEAQRPVGGGSQVEDVEQDRQREGADGYIGQRGVDRVAQPLAVQEVFDWPDRAEDRPDPADVEVAQGLGPACLGVDQTREEPTDHLRPPDSGIYSANFPAECPLSQ